METKGGKMICSVCERIIRKKEGTKVYAYADMGGAIDGKVNLCPKCVRGD